MTCDSCGLVVFTSENRLIEEKKTEPIWKDCFNPFQVVCYNCLKIRYLKKRRSQ
jgi:hypothetical protein